MKGRQVDALEEHVQLLEALALDLVDDEGAGRDPPDVAHAAEHDHGENSEAHGEPELGRRDDCQLGAEVHAGKTGGGGADGEGQELGGDCVDAHARSRQFVFANCHPGPPYPGIL